MAGSTFIAPATPFDKRHLGKFEVLCRLSTGGMSEIYLAHQSGLAGFRKLVVLKTILPDIGGEEDFVRMFLEEARTTAAFTHPNIAQVFELDVGEGQLFMAMEFVQGCTLVEMARACRTAKEAIPMGFTLQAVRDTALALHYAHTFTDARGRKQIVIHRDVAEKNIMVNYEGVTKLLDFGIAKALGSSGRTSVGMVKGTSGYMSPEQIRGEPLDPRSDIFALGVVLHECLTGLRLFHGKSAEEGMLAALRQDVVPPSKYNPAISPELDGVVLKSLARDRENRFNTALEFARAIEKVTPGLIWHPEQSGDFVQRHFADRRSETRKLLDSAAMGKESTGEIRIDSVLAQVKASAMDLSRVPTDLSKPVTPVRPQPQAPATPAPNPFAQTAPARPAVPSQSSATPPIPPPKQLDARHTPAPVPPGRRPTQGAVSINLTPAEFEDDSEAKTMPASSLPDDLKALRAKFAANNPGIASRPKPSDVSATQPPVAPASSQSGRTPRGPETPAAAPSGSQSGRTPRGPDAPPPPPADSTNPTNPVPVPAVVVSQSGDERAVTGETVSVTGRAAQPSTLNDENFDEPADVKTNVVMPRPVREQQRRASEETSAPSVRVVDTDEHEAVDQDGASKGLLIAVAVISFLLALSLLAWVLHLGPFAHPNNVDDATSQPDTEMVAPPATDVPAKDAIPTPAPAEAEPSVPLKEK